MPEHLKFRFSIQGLPEGKALTGSEIEQRLLESLDASGGTSVDSLWSLAALYQRTGHLDQASGCIRRFIDLTDDPEKIGSAYLALGQLEESRRDYDAAAKHYREALSLEPCSTQTWYFIHNNLGYALNQIGEHASAIPYLQKALSIDAGRPNAYKNLGLAHEARGDLEKAAELFIAATQVDAADPRSLEHLISLVEAHPALAVDIPDLEDRIEACKNAVEVARQRQPDFNKQWANIRAAQKRKWWQFWKRRPNAPDSFAASGRNKRKPSWWRQIWETPAEHSVTHGERSIARVAMIIALLVGLLAVTIVAYYAISLLRELHRLL